MLCTQLVIKTTTNFYDSKILRYQDLENFRFFIGVSFPEVSVLSQTKQAHVHNYFERKNVHNNIIRFIALYDS